jgi:hypothetical protein
MGEANAVDQFLKHLRQLLKKLGFPNALCDKILANIHAQMLSYLSHWNDDVFRAGLTLIGTEEAAFYKPQTPINPFVVVTVRNSMIENLHSLDYEKYGVKTRLFDESMPYITQIAIGAFRNADMSALSKEVGSPEQDYYGDVAQQHPMAWKALCELGSTDDLTVNYEIVTDPKLDIQYLSANTNVLEQDTPIDSQLKHSVVDGVSPVIEDEMLTRLLATAKSELHYMIFDCFKMVSRNFWKLLHVMEYLLSNDKAFITTNYYFENGFAQRRERLLRPAHGIKQAVENMKAIAGTRGKHREALKAAKAQMD